MDSSSGNSRHRPGILVGGVLAVTAAIAAAVVLGGVACSTDTLRKGLSGPTPSTPEELLAELKNDKTRIDQVTDEMMKRIETFNASRRPGERTIQFSEIFYEDLSPEQRDVLNQLLAEEKDVSYRSLLTNIIQDRDAIRNLQEKVLRLEQSLPDRFVLAKKGDSHHDLAMEYLTTEAQLPPEKAKDLLGQVDQTDELLPGNQVWFFYDPARDTFRTYVTQGEAGQTPLAVRRAVKRKILNERDEAVARVKSLEEIQADLEERIGALNADVATLTDRRTMLEAEVAGLQQNKAELETRVAALSDDLAFRQNSLFYHAANERELRDKGVLTAVLKRVRDVRGVDFESAIDLRKETSITLTAEAFGLDRIKDVKILPAMYQPGRDFTVETTQDGGRAKLVIHDPDVFRGKEVLLSVRG
jgi:hypothetical protein